MHELREFLLRVRPHKASAPEVARGILNHLALILEAEEDLFEMQRQRNYEKRQILSRTSCMVASESDIEALVVVCLGYPLKDGPLAGQTVPHVHIHIIPRIAGDWKDNDKIYDAIYENEKDLKMTIDCDMQLAGWAAQYRKLLSN
ncbi:FRAGILE HISTIDINE TRIAD [Artemisia annua]|uniref:FRAGILE HISTIDINE TRIAD n=1 Tax=Artemisia annua TaxID=35608 RepID=A0A2U1Q2P7_ARTAN|nr:FRAGILE HISTIDINE TRIAD [Artemisia annua]